MGERETQFAAGGQCSADLVGKRGKGKRGKGKGVTYLAASSSVVYKAWLLGVGFPGKYFSRLLQTAAAYKAKLLCSGIFVCGRDEATILKEDLAVGTLVVLRLLRSVVDYEKKTVTVSFFGMCKQVALYRPGLGSTLVVESTIAALEAQGAPFVGEYLEERKQQSFTEDSPIAVGEMSPEVDAARLAAVVESAFVESGPRRLKRTRAVVVVHKGEIIAERYAPGFSAQTPMLGWSMAKSVVNALVGILVKDGKLSLSDTQLLAAWRGKGDPRGEITLDQLLRMSSGLAFSEVYTDPRSDVLTVLFQQGDGAGYAARRPLAARPGSEFCYSGGSTVLLCRIIREAVGGSLADYFAFPRRALFDRIGMASAVMEPDAAGTFVGSSFMYATARDWARFGLLYLWDGCWLFAAQRLRQRLRSATGSDRQLNSERNRLQSVCVADKVAGSGWERILPEGWVDYSTAPSERADFYGAHFWRGVPNSFTDRARSGDGGWPRDAYLAAGYQGQFVTVVPSCELVVVRLGLSQQRNSWDQVAFIKSVVNAVKG